MPYGGTMQGIGAIAEGFSRGFREARSAKDAEAQRKANQQWERAHSLLSMADQMPDVKMKETLFGAAYDLINGLESGGGKKKQDKKGLGSMLAGLFGFGRDDQPETTVMTPEKNVNPEQLPTTPDTRNQIQPLSPDSRTYGTLSNLIGNADQAVPRAPMELPPVPMPQAGTAVKSSTDFSEPGFAFSLPEKRTPQDMIASATEKHSSPRFGFVDKEKAAADVKSQASEYVDELLGVMDAYLDRHGDKMGLFSAATADQEFGPHFKRVMDEVARLEGSGLIQKGYLDQWKQNRFADARPGYKAPEPPREPTAKERIDGIFLKNPASWTMEERDAVSGWARQMHMSQSITDPTRPVNADDKLKFDYVNAIQKDEATRTPEDQRAIRAFEQYQRLLNPIQPPSNIILPGGTAEGGRRKLTFVNPRTLETKVTDFALPSNLDLNRIMVTKKDVKVPSKTHPDRFDYQDIQVFDVEQVKQAFRNGELGGPEALIDIINSGQFEKPEDAEALSTFLRQQQNPFNK